MGYKCASCGVDFPNKKLIVEHMINVHNSPFVEGDSTMVELSKSVIKGKTTEEKSNFAKLYEANGDSLEV